VAQRGGGRHCGGPVLAFRGPGAKIKNGPLYNSIILVINICIYKITRLRSCGVDATNRRKGVQRRQTKCGEW
jgi:hypothetical protein